VPPIQRDRNSTGMVAETVCPIVAPTRARGNGADPYSQVPGRDRNCGQFGNSVSCPTPLHFVPLAEEVPRAIIDILINGFSDQRTTLTGPTRAATDASGAGRFHANDQAGAATYGVLAKAIASVARLKEIADATRWERICRTSSRYDTRSSTVIPIIDNKAVLEPRDGFRNHFRWHQKPLARLYLFAETVGDFNIQAAFGEEGVQ
jgi:hypothetical protein